MKIPYDKLQPETLRAVIEDFVTREGTDYGFEETSLEQKVQQVMEQLKQGKAAISYNQKLKNCSIVRDE